MALADGSDKLGLLGVCVVYLGGLNYFFPVEETTPVVSTIGTVVGRLELRITPFIAVLQAAGSSSSEETFVPYEHADVDSAEEQVHEYMDRSLQYRVELRRLSGLKTRRFSFISLRYTFFREAGTQTPRFAVSKTNALGLEFRHVVDVSDAFVKYVTGGSLTLEVFGHAEGSS